LLLDLVLFCELIDAAPLREFFLGIFISLIDLDRSLWLACRLPNLLMLPVAAGTALEPIFLRRCADASVCALRRLDAESLHEFGAPFLLG
jgi:hypothetical protein